jgi:hypothetical protein
MGKILGTNLTDEQELAILKIVKYYKKVENMIKEYANAKNRAIAKYGKFATNPQRVSNYSDAWATMPAAYSAIMSDKRGRVIDWLIGYLSKMFNYPFPAERDAALAEAGRIFDAIVEYYRRQGVSVT